MCLKGKKGPPAGGAAPKGLGGVELEKQPLRFADANHLPFQGRQSILNAIWYQPDDTTYGRRQAAGVVSVGCAEARQWIALWRRWRGMSDRRVL